MSYHSKHSTPLVMGGVVQARDERDNALQLLAVAREELREKGTQMGETTSRYASLTRDYEQLDSRLRDHEAIADSHVTEWLAERRRLQALRTRRVGRYRALPMGV